MVSDFIDGNADLFDGIDHVFVRDSKLIGPIADFARFGEVDVTLLLRHFRVDFRFHFFAGGWRGCSRNRIR